MIELFCFIIGTSMGACASWLAAGIHYRKLITELINRNCAIIAQMRQEHEASSSQSTSAA